jgi:hypothetical protein
MGPDPNNGESDGPHFFLQLELESGAGKGRIVEAETVFGLGDHRHPKKAGAGTVVTDIWRQHGCWAGPNRPGRPSWRP